MMLHTNTGRTNSGFKAIALSCALAIGATSTLAATTAHADIVATQDVIAQEQTIDARATIAGFMARSDVQAEMRRQGVDPAEAEARVAALTDAEAEKLAETIRTDPSGQGAVGVIVGAGLIIFFVLLITDILGETDVYSFTN